MLAIIFCLRSVLSASISNWWLLSPSRIVLCVHEISLYRRTVTVSKVREKNLVSCKVFSMKKPFQDQNKRLQRISVKQRSNKWTLYFLISRNLQVSCSSTPPYWVNRKDMKEFFICSSCMKMIYIRKITETLHK